MNAWMLILYWKETLTTLYTTCLLKPKHPTYMYHTGAKSVFTRCIGAWDGGKITGSFTYRLIGADGVDLGPKHDCCEDQEEKALKAQEDEKDDGCWWREVTALWWGNAEQEGEEMTCFQVCYVTLYCSLGEYPRSALTWWRYASNY